MLIFPTAATLPYRLNLDDVGAKTHHENQLIREEMVKIKPK